MSQPGAGQGSRSMGEDEVFDIEIRLLLEGIYLRYQHDFRNYAVEKLPYAIDRYVNETNRLYGVLNKRLADREFIAGAYSIADMASYPWVVPYKNQGQEIDDFPHLKRWLETIGKRPATERAYAKAKEVNPNFGQPAIRTEEERKLLFGQTAAVVR